MATNVIDISSTTSSSDSEADYAPRGAVLPRSWTRRPPGPFVIRPRSREPSVITIHSSAPPSPRHSREPQNNLSKGQNSETVSDESDVKEVLSSVERDDPTGKEVLLPQAESMPLLKQESEVPERKPTLSQREDELPDVEDLINPPRYEIDDDTPEPLEGKEEESSNEEEISSQSSGSDTDMQASAAADSEDKELIPQESAPADSDKEETTSQDSSSAESENDETMSEDSAPIASDNEDSMSLDSASVNPTYAETKPQDSTPVQGIQMEAAHEADDHAQTIDDRQADFDIVREDAIRADRHGLDFDESLDFRTAKVLPYELREQCLIYLEESLYPQALGLLETLLSSSSLPSYTGATMVAPVKFLALIVTLSVHPRFTSRPKSDIHTSTSILAMKYIGDVLRLTGTVNSGLVKALQFPAGRGRPHPSFRAKRSPEHVIECVYSKDQALWTQAQDIWHVIGWAFICSVMHPARWTVWSRWLDFLLKILEKDWALQNAEKGKDCMKQPLIVQYIKQASKTGGFAKRIVRAVFAATSQAEFPEVWKNETQVSNAEVKVAVIQQRKRKLDIAEDEYADYAMSDETNDDSMAPEGSTPRQQSTQCKEASRGDELLGGSEALAYRLRFLALFSNVAEEYSESFMTTETLYATYLEHIRYLPLDVFANLICPRRLLSSMQVKAATPFLQYTVSIINSCSVPVPYMADLSQDLLEDLYLPFHASRENSVAENARVSLCVEALTRMLHSCSDGLVYSKALHQAAKKGIKARKQSIQHDDQAVEADKLLLKESGKRIRMVIRHAKAKVIVKVEKVEETST